MPRKSFSLGFIPILVFLTLTICATATNTFRTESLLLVPIVVIQTQWKEVGFFSQLLFVVFVVADVAVLSTWPHHWDRFAPYFLVQIGLILALSLVERYRRGRRQVQ